MVSVVGVLACFALLASASSQDCQCSPDGSPVCGSDGLNYDNECTFSCAQNTNSNLTLTHTGECQNHRQTRAAKYPCACKRDYRPVCGSDGITYGNECTFYCKKNTKPNLTLKHKGECKGRRQPRAAANPICPCTRERNPTCGSNGVTYSNPCLLKCAAKSIPGLRKAHSGPCLKDLIKNVGY